MTQKEPSFFVFLRGLNLDIFVSFAPMIFISRKDSHMRQLILPIILMTAAFTQAADVAVNGNINADYATYWDKDFDPTNAANQDIDLSLSAYLNESFSAIVKTNIHSNYIDSMGNVQASEVRHSQSRATAMGDTDNRFTDIKFDGVLFRWEINPNVATVFGDLSYNAGNFNYYFWRDSSRYNVISQEQRLRGIGVELEGGKVYIGASENNSSSILAFGSYPIELLSRTEERLVLTPSIEWAFGSTISRSYTYALGIEATYAKSKGKMNYGVTATWGTHPYKGESVHSFLLEPSFNFDFFNIGVSFYQALVAEPDSAVQEQIFTEDQTLFFIEPSIDLHKKASLGIAYEYHDPSNEIEKDHRQFIGPNIYVYPTINTEIVFWGGYNILPEKANNFSMGISGHTHF